MGIGYNCCKDTTSTLEGKIVSYSGNPSLRMHNYLNGQRFSQINNDLAPRITRFNAPLFIHDIKKGSKYLSIACGASGIRAWRASKDGKYSLRTAPHYNFLNYLSGGNKTFNGAQSFLGSYFAGNQFGSRYGFEYLFGAKNFSGAYGVCSRGDYIYVARGTNGVWRVEPESKNVKQLLKGNDATIISKVEIINRKLFVATSGYDKPKFSYKNSFQQYKYQPEYKSSEPFWSNLSSKTFSAIGVYVYDLDVLESNDSASGFLGYANISGHVNSMKEINGEMYVATGSRSGSNSMGSGGGLFKITEDDNGRFLVESEYSAQGSVLDIDSDGDDVYCVDSAVGVIKNGSIAIQIMIGTNASGFTEIAENIEYCLDGNIICSTGFPTFQNYAGATGAKILIRDFDVGSGSDRTVRDICPPFNQPYRTSETIEIMPNSIQVSGNSICVGLLQGGLAIFSKESGSLQTHIPGLYRRPLCSNFKTRSLSPLEYDANPEFTLSVGKMVKDQGQLHAIDSIEYIANGAGPRVYSPLRTSENVRDFIGLVKGYKTFSGIFTLK